MKSVKLKTVANITGVQSPMAQYCTSEGKLGNTSNVTKNIVKTETICFHTFFKILIRSLTPPA